MAVDAKVSQVSELTAYAGKMSEFMESVNSNCTALNNILVQKLDALKKTLEKAERLEAEAVGDFHKLIDAMSKTANNDVEGRRALLAQKQRIEQRRDHAKLMCAEVKLRFVTARGTVLYITDLTKQFQKKLQQNVYMGRQVIKKSVAQLEQYNDTKNKI